MEQNTDQFESIDLREYARVILKKWKFIIVFVLFAMMAAGVVSKFILSPVYAARTTLFVGKEQQTEENSLNYSDVMLNAQLVKDYQVLAKSRIITQEVIDQLGLDMTPDQLRGNIDVVLQSDTRIIEMKAISTDAELAAEIANTLSQVFIKRAQEIMKVQNVQVVDKAEVPQSPIKPRLTLNVAIAAVLAFMVSIFIIFLVEYLDHTIKTSEDVEKYLGLTPIGVIPHMKQEDLEV